MIKEKLKIDRSSKIILSMFLIYFVVALILFLPIYISRIHDKIYIITDDVQAKYEYGKWSISTDNKDYSSNSFEVYENGNYKGKYNVSYSLLKINLYDGDNRVSSSGKLLTYSSNVPMSAFPISDESITESDMDIISRALATMNLVSNNEFNVFQKININDGKNNKTIYCVSNFFTVSSNSNTKFSVIFTYDNGTFDIIKSSTTIDEPEGTEYYKLVGAFDIKKDGKYELLYVSEYYSLTSDSCPVLINLSKSKKIIRNFCN